MAGMIQRMLLGVGPARNEPSVGQDDAVVRIPDNQSWPSGRRRPRRAGWSTRLPAIML